MANNTFEAAYMKLKNGMTLFFKDGTARELIDRLQAAVSLIKSIPAGGTTDQVLKKHSNDDYDVEWGAGGGTTNTWYGTCTTATGTADKVATTVTGDFVLAEGNMAVIRFVYYNNQTEPYLSIDGCTKKRIKDRSGTGNITTALWRDGECITVAYDGTDFIVVEGGTASTSYYGVTKLSNSYMSTSQSLAATPQAVKSVYDIASAAYSPSNPPPTPSPSDATPQDLGTAAAGSSADYSRADHVHTKPTYSKSDVGLGNVDNVQQYSASNPPPYPVTSVNGQTGSVTVPGALYFTGQPVAAMTGNICTISDAAITGDYIVVSGVFASPSSVKSPVTWTTSSGSLVLNGTCYAATTVSVVLVPKDN